MINYIILCISMLACLTGNIVRKYSGDSFKNKNAMYHVYNAFLSVAAVLGLLALGGIPQISLFTLLLGIMFGVVTALQSVFQLKAYVQGPFSYTVVIVTLSSVIPALSGHFIWGEEITLVQIIGILFMIASFLCFIDFSGDEKKSNLLWFLYAFIAFVCTGIIGVTQKYQQNTVYRSELDGFLIIAFAASTVYSLANVLIISMKQTKEENTLLKKEITAKALVLMIIAGFCAAGNNKMNIYLSGVLDSAMFFPTVNGVGLILSTVSALVIFKEKILPLKWVGIAVGLVSVVLLCNPF
ncbi:MAG: hypothetical protein IJ460_01760 [Clostridia bacterium]|nr:hypothetical protein [Clostridia bacterium]